jgi:hypothetical protein
MKIDKTKFIKFLKEGLETEAGRLKIDLNTDALENKLDQLMDRFEELDISIDYLAAAFSGEDPVAIDIGQSALGRAATPRARKETRNEASP